VTGMTKVRIVRMDHGHHCFLRGTRILTPGGEIPVEDFAIGVPVETLSVPLPLKWIGHQRFRKRLATPGIGAWRRFGSLALFSAISIPVVTCTYPRATAFLSTASSFRLNGW
jgi:hypothetical protein